VAGEQADHSPLSNAKVKNEWSYTSSPPLCLLICIGIAIPVYKNLVCIKV
jgi:hypothetical protein